MQYDEFIHRVQERTDLADEDTAVRVTEAVLGTLGECLYRTERRKLGAQLPKQLRASLYSVQSPENTRQDTERFSLEEFYNRIRARADIGGRDTEPYTRAVLAVLQEAVSAGEIADVMDKLPAEYSTPFQQQA